MNASFRFNAVLFKISIVGMTVSAAAEVVGKMVVFGSDVNCANLKRKYGLMKNELTK